MPDRDAETRKDDLRTGTPFWVKTPHSTVTAEREADAGHVDVIVVGAGISGALMAEALSRAGRSVLILDRRPPVRGSTPASTAMIQHEIDVPLTVNRHTTLTSFWSEPHGLDHSAPFELSRLPGKQGFELLGGSAAEVEISLLPDAVVVVPGVFLHDEWNRSEDDQDDGGRQDCGGLEAQPGNDANCGSCPDVRGCGQTFDFMPLRANHDGSGTQEANPLHDALQDARHILDRHSAL